MASTLRKRLAEGTRIRVLVVDDSVVIRRLVTHALSEDPQLEVVGFAADGEVALRRVAELRPDVITLDVEMPVMDGLETLRRLKAQRSETFVIMFSTLTERGAMATIDALSLGASDYVAKAANAGSLDRSMESLRRDLVPKIKQFFALPAAQTGSGPEPSRTRPESVPVLEAVQSGLVTAPLLTRRLVKRQVVGIGVSTGGPNALAAIIPMIPANFELPVLIVQHMPPVFTRLLAERLSTLTPLRVEEAADGTPVEGGKILLAPGDRHMQVKNAAGGVVIEINQNPPEHSCRPSVDVLFRSLAAVYGGEVVAAVLTGMGNDGTRGAEALHAKGAYVIAQDEASSVVWGMPGGVVNAKAADAVVDLQRVVPEILSNL